MQDLSSRRLAKEHGLPCDDAALVRRAQASDQMAFREIVERYQARVFGLICRILHDRIEAEDIAQEVFASAFFAIRTFEYQGTLLGWLYRIAVNQSFQYLRRKKVRPLVYESGLSKECRQSIAASSAARNPAPGIDVTLAQREFVLGLLACLSREDRCLLLMKEVEGYSVQEMTAITGLTESSVKVKLFRARRKLIRAAGKRLISEPLASREAEEAEACPTP